MTDEMDDDIKELGDKEAFEDTVAEQDEEDDLEDELDEDELEDEADKNQKIVDDEEVDS